MFDKKCHNQKYNSDYFKPLLYIITNNMKQTALDWFIENLPNRFKNAILNECGEEIKKAKAMEKEQIKNALILFCDTESYGACDIKDWVKNNGVIFKDKDTDSQIVDRVDYFVDNILNHNI